MHQLPSPELTPYELMVKRNIEQNRQILEGLGLLDKHVEKVRKTVSHKRRISITPKREPSNGSFSSYYNPVRTRRSSALLDATGMEEFSADDLDDQPPQKRPKVIRENVFGAIEGVKVGDWWMTRMECSATGVHRPTVAGISGKMGEGCYSIALSGGYEDDIDCGEYFTYTGSGGRDLKGTRSNPKNLRTAPQSKDQVFDGMNAALASNIDSKKPVRVIRGYKLPGPFAPDEGYRYDGLYSVEKCWEATGLSGFKVCKFALKRLPSQDPPPWAVNLQETEERCNEENVPTSSSSPDDSNTTMNLCLSSPTQGVNKKIGLSPTSCKQRRKLHSIPTNEENITFLESVLVENLSQSYEESEVFSQHSAEHTLYRRLSPRANNITPESLTDRMSSIIPTVNAGKEIKRNSPKLVSKTSVDKENLLKVNNKDDHQDFSGSLQNGLKKSKCLKTSKDEQIGQKEQSLASCTKTSSNEEQQCNDENEHSFLTPVTNIQKKLSKDLTSVFASSLIEPTGATNETTAFGEYSSKNICTNEREEIVKKEIKVEIPSELCYASTTVISGVSLNEQISKFTVKRSSPQTTLRSSTKRAETESVDLDLEPSLVVTNNSSGENEYDAAPTQDLSTNVSQDSNMLLTNKEFNSPSKKVRFSSDIFFKDVDGNSSVECDLYSDLSSDNFKGFDALSNPFRGFEALSRKGDPNYSPEPARPVRIMSSPNKTQTSILKYFKCLNSLNESGDSFKHSPVYPKSLRGNQIFSSSPLTLINNSTVETTEQPSATSTSPVNTSPNSIDSSEIKDCVVLLEKINVKNEAKSRFNSHDTSGKIVRSSYHKRKYSPFNTEFPTNMKMSLSLQPTLAESLVQKNKEKGRLYDTISRKRLVKSELKQTCKPCSVVLVDLCRFRGFDESFPGFDMYETDLFDGFNLKDIETAQKSSDDFKKSISHPPKGRFLGWESTKHFQGSSGLVPVGFNIDKLSES